MRYGSGKARNLRMGTHESPVKLMRNEKFYFDRFRLHVCSTYPADVTTSTTSPKDNSTDENSEMRK